MNEVIFLISISVDLFIFHKKRDYFEHRLISIIEKNKIFLGKCHIFCVATIFERMQSKES